MGRGENCFRATKDSFDRVLGPRRGLALTDSLASERPTERSLQFLAEIGEQLAAGDEALALAELNRWPGHVEDRPLLSQLADNLADSRIRRQFAATEGALRQLASDLDIVPQWAETLVEKDGQIHLWPGGAGKDGLEVEGDEQSVCGQSLAGSFRAERGSWMARPESHCSDCRGEEHLPECSEEVDYAIFDKDLEHDRAEGAESSLRFTIGKQLTERGRLEEEQLDLFTDEAVTHANYEALARQAERNNPLVLARLFPDLARPESKRPLHWYNHLRAAGEFSARSAERKKLLQERIRPLLEE